MKVLHVEIFIGERGHIEHTVYRYDGGEELSEYFVSLDFRVRMEDQHDREKKDRSLGDKEVRWRYRYTAGEEGGDVTGFEKK
jgi:hypothetical protein